MFKEEDENLKVKNSWILPESWSLLFRSEIVLARQGGGLESSRRIYHQSLHLFNYTQNYHEGTYQAKRHHSEWGAKDHLSLHKPPRTAVEQFAVNVHWSTQNVNLSLDFAHSLLNNFFVDSKDAQVKVHADMSPVQKPGKIWWKMTLPDHNWTRSAHNPITPMSHQFTEQI